MNSCIKGHLKMLKQNIYYRTGVNLTVSLPLSLNISAQLSDLHGGKLRAAIQLNFTRPTDLFPPPHTHSNSFEKTCSPYPLLPLLLTFFLGVIYDLCVFCWHQEVWGILSMKILWPRWPLLRMQFASPGFQYSRLASAV